MSKKTKVLQIVEDMNIGGIEEMIATFTRHLNKDKFDIEVWCVATGGPLADQLVSEGYTVRILNIYSYRSVSSFLRMIADLQDSKCDIIHTHGYYGSVIGRIAAKLAGIKTVINHVHSTYYNYNARHIFIENVLAFFTQRILCCSQAVKDFVVDVEDIKADKVQVLYNGVDLNCFSPRESSEEIRDAFDIDKGGVIIGVVASLSEHKGHRFLLDAFAKIHEQVPNAKLMFVGKGDQKDALVSQANELGIVGKIIFTGAQQDVAKMLSVMDIFVLPNAHREGLGIALIEAMAMGLPLVSFRVGGIPEVIDDQENGFLVVPENTRDMAQAILKLLTDKELRKQMGQCGIQKAKKNFSQEHMIKQLEQVYESYVEVA